MSWLSQKSKEPAGYVLPSRLSKFPLLVWLWLLLMEVLSSLGTGIVLSDGVTNLSQDQQHLTAIIVIKDQLIYCFSSSMN
jgi:hypothetical protein